MFRCVVGLGYDAVTKERVRCVVGLGYDAVTKERVPLCCRTGV